MAKISQNRRRFDIRKKQKRRFKLGKLRQSFSETKTNREKQLILEKVFKIAPYLSEKEFLEPLEKKKKS